MIKKDNISAFTFVELIISSLIIFAVGLVVYSAFSGGISVWKRSERFRVYEGSFRMGLESMARELRNAVNYSEIPFNGNEDSVFFASLIEDLSSESDKPVYSLGRTGYFVNDKDIICRQQQSYGQVFQGPDTGIVKELIANVKELRFTYFGLDKESKTYKWFDVWPPVSQEEEALDKEEESFYLERQGLEFGLPRAVKIDLELERKGLGLIDVTKTVIMPLEAEPELISKEADQDEQDEIYPDI
jgi:hypothetical protein